jgi:hypothetical protein
MDWRFEMGFIGAFGEERTAVGDFNVQPNV